MARYLLPFTCFLAGLLLQSIPAPGQTLSTEHSHTVYPKEEFRGTWIATVYNLDWPRSTSPTAQQSELIALLDELKTAGINAVFFQVRSAADAFYASSYEPWSAWLTGEQGRPPEPFYDPLAFAIEEAHKRGMELHAWINPFRAVTGDTPLAPNHIAVTHPEWLLSFDGGNLKILNPGIPDVRSYIADVIMDIVTRYDVDGIHYDDYFYPYPPNEITTEDQDTYATYGTGFTSIATWRRYNINMFVRTVHERLTAFEQETGRIIKHGVSPFGIWRSGVPAGIVGLSAYDVIYADAPNWLAQGWVDYLVPQLYWPFGGGQDYAKLAPWWASQMNGRHLYTGHGLYRSDPNTYAGTLFSPGEIPAQVRFNRARDDIHGSVFFRARNLTTYPSQGFSDSLKTDLFAVPALTPMMTWKDLIPPPAPVAFSYTWLDDETIALSWSLPEVNETNTEARRFAVYRVQADSPPDPETVLADSRNLLGVTGTLSWHDRPLASPVPYHYYVTAVSANSVESTATAPVSVFGRAVAVEPDVPPLTLHLQANYPNPFREATTIRFGLRASAHVTLTVYNVLGQEVRRLVDAVLAPGTHEVRWDGRSRAGDPLPSGTYFLLLSDGRQRQSLAATRVR
ncbi:MAG: hypothetical protein KatS3mg043_0601 [Rhodothermaceae bacterium]|nr:MAG: hypothetical protein KatS3mg043_0601 [Rhodothermaceae bacterium]